MSRKHKQKNVLPYQTKHLRFVSPESEPGANDAEILNNGGFTLAYRVLDLALATLDTQQEWDSDIGLVVQVAYSECHLDDNYDKKRGRHTASARLDHMASNWSHAFLLEAPRPADDDIIKLAPGTAIVDLRGMESALAQAVVHSFINEQQDLLFNGGNLESFHEYLIEYKGTLALDAAVLLTDDTDMPMGGLDLDQADAVEEHLDTIIAEVDVIAGASITDAQRTALNNILAAATAIRDIAVGSMPDDAEDDEDDSDSDDQDDDDEDGDDDQDDEDDEESRDIGEDASDVPRHLVASSIEVITTPPVEDADQQELVKAADENDDAEDEKAN